MRIAYIMSRFPKLTETFILYEMLAIEAQGQEVEIYPLMREKATVIQHEARPLVDRAHFTPFISMMMIWVNLWTLVTYPITYLRTLVTLIRSNLGSRRFLLGNLLYFPKAVLLAHMMQENKIEHIHAHFASFPAAVAYIIHQFSGIPYSFTAHGSDLHRDQHMLCEKIQDSKQTITISSYNRQFMLDHCGQQYASTIQVVHCGINLDYFNTDQTTSLDEDLSIICIGSLHEVKGQQYLLEACGILKQQKIQFHCHLVGDGPDRDMLTKLASDRGIADNVTFHGRLTQPDVIAQLKKANVAALNSVPTMDGRREGIPVALMECMAFYLPVVATRLSGIPELVDDGITGFLTEARDSRAIAEALHTLAQNPQLRIEMGRAGRRKIEQEFELHTNAHKLIDILT